MRKTPLRRKTPLQSKPKRKPRSAEEYARIYGSKERVAFVKALPCLYCCAVHPLIALAWHPDAENRVYSENAHTVTGGKGRKADADTIVPLCPTHHRMYDRREKLLGNPEVRAYLQSKAPEVEAMWRRECARRKSR